MDNENIEEVVADSAAIENWLNNGSLGVTAEDFLAVGDTPDEILLKNPGKTLGELMSDEDIEEFLLDTSEIIESNEEDIKANPDNADSLKEENQDLKDNLETTIKYLKRIGKLPSSFE